MKIEIQKKILEKYPEAQIGFLVAHVSVKETDLYVEALKEGLEESLKSKGINETNFAAHPNIAIWRKIYENDFHVKPKTYRSSVEALVKRVVGGKSIWKINQLVDLYNYCSVLSLLPMGGYDLDKIVGDIQIRYAKEGEPFQGLGEKEVAASENHIVYADDEGVICWLWNHKDAARTCIDERSKTVLFFIDAANGDVQEGIDLLFDHLRNIGAISLQSGILNRNSPDGHIECFSRC